MFERDERGCLAGWAEVFSGSEIERALPTMPLQNRVALLSAVLKACDAAGFPYPWVLFDLAAVDRKAAKEVLSAGGDWTMAVALLRVGVEADTRLFAHWSGITRRRAIADRYRMIAELLLEHGDVPAALTALTEGVRYSDDLLQSSVAKMLHFTMPKGCTPVNWTPAQVAAEFKSYASASHPNELLKCVYRLLQAPPFARNLDTVQRGLRSNALAAGLHRVGWAALASQDLALAVEALERALTTVPRNSTFRERIVGTLLKALHLTAKEAQEASEWAVAARCHMRILALEPVPSMLWSGPEHGWPTRYRDLARCLSALGDQDGAHAAFVVAAAWDAQLLETPLAQTLKVSRADVEFAIPKLAKESLSADRAWRRELTRMAEHRLRVVTDLSLEYRKDCVCGRGQPGVRSSTSEDELVEGVPTTWLDEVVDGFVEQILTAPVDWTVGRSSEWGTPVEGPPGVLRIPVRVTLENNQPRGQAARVRRLVLARCNSAATDSDGRIRVEDVFVEQVHEERTDTSESIAAAWTELRDMIMCFANGAYERNHVEPDNWW